MALSPACANAINKVKRNAVRINGVNGIRALSRALGITLDDSEEVIQTTVFVDVLTQFGVFLSEADRQALSKWLDRTAEGILCPAEFITALRHIDSPYRRALVQRVLHMFRKDQEGFIRVGDIQRRYAPERHPQVLRGETTAEEVRAHLTESFSEEGNPSGAVSSAELQQYFAGLSAVIDTDHRFAAVLRGCWQLPSFDDAVTEQLAMLDATDSGLSCRLKVQEKVDVLLAATLRKALQDTLDAHHRQLLANPAGFRAVGTALRRADPETTGFVSRSEFLSALATVHLYFERPEVIDRLDVNDNGSVDYLWYLHAVVGELTPARQLAAERLWRKMPTDEDGCVELAWLHDNYITSSAETLSLFFDSWDKRKATSVKAGVPRVTMFELLNEWFVPISAKILKDVDFAKQLNTEWPLDELKRSRVLDKGIVGTTSKKQTRKAPAAVTA